jgi:hypothetical protein
MKRLILCAFSLFLLFGCGNRSGFSSRATDVTDSVELNTGSLGFSRIFSPAMQEAINVFDKYVEKDSKHKMFIELFFYEQGEHCFFQIFESFFYSDSTILGYFKSNDRLYVVANPVRLNKVGGWMTLQNDGTAIMNVPVLNCMDSFVNTSELVPFVDSLPGYPKFEGPFDPKGIAFQIISPDSLKLIHVGYL